MSNKNNKEPRLQFIQGQVDETTGIMKKNIDAVLERGEKIEDLQSKTDDLARNSQSFKINSRTLKNRLLCQNYKLTAAIVAVVLLLLLIIIVPLAVKFSN